MAFYHVDTMTFLCRVFDANGLEWKRLVSIDTETGEVEQLAHNENGELEFDESGQVIRKRFKIPTPVQIVKIGNKLQRAELDVDV